MLHYFKNINFRKKVALICLFISIIPVILLGTFCYTQVRQLLIDRENTAFSEALKQEVHNLDYKINSYQNSINYIIWNETIRNSLVQTYSKNYDMYLLYRDILDPLFLTIRSMHTEISRITLYTNNPIYSHGTTLKALSDLASKSWYQEALSKTRPFFVASTLSHTLLLVCQMYLPDCKYTNIVCMELNYNKTFRSLSKLFDNSYGITIIDKENQPVYFFSNFSSDNQKYALTPAELLIKTENGSIENDYVFKTLDLSSENWKA